MPLEVFLSMCPLGLPYNMATRCGDIALPSDILMGCIAYEVSVWVTFRITTVSWTVAASMTKSRISVEGMAHGNGIGMPTYGMPQGRQDRHQMGAARLLQVRF